MEMVVFLEWCVGRRRGRGGLALNRRDSRRGGQFEDVPALGEEAGEGTGREDGHPGGGRGDGFREGDPSGRGPVEIAVDVGQETLLRFQDRCFELFRRDDPPPISLRGPAVSGSLEGRADAVVTEAERITAMAIGQWRVENRRDQESVGVDADEPGQREDPLVRHGLVVCRPVLGIRRGKERIPLRLDHRPGDVEAGCQSRKAVGAEQGLGEDGGHC